MSSFLYVEHLPLGRLRSLLIVWLFLLSTVWAQRTLHVPQDISTIQSAIDQSVNGDSVLVSPGHYFERIDFHGKAITVRGESASTVILDGNGYGPVVTFSSREGRTSVLSNLTIQNGRAPHPGSAGGIYINQASPSLSSLVVQKNFECGIGSFNGAPAIQGTLVQENLQETASGCMITLQEESGGGGGILLYGESPDGLYPILLGNRITKNYAIHNAAGIFAVAAGTVVIQNNLIWENESADAGAAILTELGTVPRMLQNLIYRNVVRQTLQNPRPGSKAAVWVARQNNTDSSEIVIAHNTIAYNQLIVGPGFLGTRAGSQIFLDLTNSHLRLANNLVVGDDPYAPIDCSAFPTTSAVTPIFDHNDVYSSGLGSASPFGGICTNQIGHNGNIAADPQFLSTNPSMARDFTLKASSPAADAGNNGDIWTATDFDGNPRVQDSRGSGTPIVDLGAYELAGIPGSAQPQPPPPTGSTIRVSLNPSTLTLRRQEHGSVAVTIAATQGSPGQVTLSCGSLPPFASCAFGSASLAMTAGQTKTVTLIIDTNANTGVSAVNRKEQNILSLCFLFSLSLVGLRLPRYKKGFTFFLSISLFPLCLLSLVSLTGCSEKYTYLAAPGQYSIVVTARSATVSPQSAALSLVVTE